MKSSVVVVLARRGSILDVVVHTPRLLLLLPTKEAIASPSRSTENASEHCHSTTPKLSTNSIITLLRMINLLPTAAAADVLVISAKRSSVVCGTVVSTGMSRV
jgi:hypothetical protein